jgi:hypothetical protein
VKSKVKCAIPKKEAAKRNLIRYSDLGNINPVDSILINAAFPARYPAHHVMPLVRKLIPSIMR